MSRQPSTTDLMSIIKDHARRLRKMETAPQLGNSSIGSGGIRVTDGGSIIADGGAVRVIGPNGQTSFYFGGITPRLADGTLQPGFILYRNDGTVAAALYDPTPDVDYQQFLALWDREQHIVVSDDTASGRGLATPYIPLPMGRARYTDWPAVTDATFVEVHRGLVYRQHPRVVAYIRATTDVAGTTGEFRLMADGVQIGDTVDVGFVVANNTVVGEWPVGEHLTGHVLTVQARRTAGTGNVRVECSAIYGIQS